MAGVAYFYGRKGGVRGTPRSLLLVWSIGSILQPIGFTVAVFSETDSPTGCGLRCILGVAICVAVLGAFELGYLMHSPAPIVLRDREDFPAEKGREHGPVRPPAGSIANSRYWSICHLLPLNSSECL